MILILASLLVLLVLMTLFFLLEIRKRKQLQENATNRIRNSRRYTRMLDAILQNTHAYILWIDKDCNVLKTNYYKRMNIADTKEVKKIGDLLCCRQALLSGMCGTHVKCTECVMRNAIHNAFLHKRNFTKIRVGLTSVVSEEKTVELEGVVSGAYFNTDGEDYMVLTIHDITELTQEQKNTEAMLEGEKEKAEEANQLKSAFLANMSHEIRTPLNAIIGFSELLASANSEEEKEQYLQIVRTNNEMLLQLINDILDIAKIEAGILEFAYSDVDINQLTSELNTQFELKLKEKNKDKVKLVYEPSLPLCMLYTDRNRLTQVLSNFMSNALKFTSEGTIRMGYKEHPKGIYFYVADTGVGIRKEKLEEVFGRFARFNKAKKGNGLGLSISKMIIEKLGGEIGLSSVYGEGCTFWFILPTNNRPKLTEVKEGKTVACVAMPDSADTSDTSRPNEKKYTILVAEDMPDNYHLCEAILSHRYNLLWAQNGEEAVSMFLKHQPDTILMDLKMPKVDGYAATEAIRQMSTTIPIIALTAFAYSGDRDKVMKSGFSDFMTKPVNAGLLLDKVENFCKHYNL